MKRDPIQANVLATKLIPNVSPGMERAESEAGAEIPGADHGRLR